MWKTLFLITVLAFSIQTRAQVQFELRPAFYASHSKVWRETNQMLGSVEISTKPGSGFGLLFAVRANPNSRLQLETGMLYSVSKTFYAAQPTLAGGFSPTVPPLRWQYTYTHVDFPIRLLYSLYEKGARRALIYGGPTFGLVENSETSYRMTIMQIPWSTDYLDANFDGPFSIENRRARFTIGGNVGVRFYPLGKVPRLCIDAGTLFYPAQHTSEIRQHGYIENLTQQTREDFYFTTTENHLLFYLGLQYNLLSMKAKRASSRPLPGASINTKQYLQSFAPQGPQPRFRFVENVEA